MNRFITLLVWRISSRPSLNCNPPFTNPFFPIILLVGKSTTRDLHSFLHDINTMRSPNVPSNNGGNNSTTCSLSFGANNGSFVPPISGGNPPFSQPLYSITFPFGTHLGFPGTSIPTMSTSMPHSQFFLEVEVSLVLMLEVGLHLHPKLLLVDIWLQGWVFPIVLILLLILHLHLTLVIFHGVTNAPWGSNLIGEVMHLGETWLGGHQSSWW